MASGFSVSYIIKAQDKFSGPARKIKKSFQGVTKSADGLSKGLKRTESRLKRLPKVIDKTTKSLKKMRAQGGEMALKVSAPVAAFGGVALTQAAKLETLTVGFETMLKSADKAEATMRSLTKFTATTPFQLEGVATAGRQLLVAGVGVDDLQASLRVLGDIASGANVPLTDMSAIFAKVKNKGKAYTEELLQLSDRGIPILDVLSKGLGVSKDRVFELASKGKISADIIEAAFKKMTQAQSESAEAGVFFNSTLKQSKTLAGGFSTLKDNLALTSGAMGDIFAETLGIKGAIHKLNVVLGKLPEKFKAFKESNPILAKMASIFGVLLMVIGPVIAVVAQIAIGIVALKFVAIALGPALAAGFWPFTLIVGAIALAIGAFVALRNNWDSIINKAKEVGAAIKRYVLDKINAIKNMGGKVAGYFGFDDPPPNNANINGKYEQSFSGSLGIEVKAADGTTARIKDTTESDYFALGISMR